MIKYLYILLFLCSVHFGKSQNLISKNQITNISETPIYERLTHVVDDKTIWKDEYQYLDDMQ